MSLRWRFGPVFVYDMMMAARRWQVYAGRAAFVLVLLIGLTIAWAIRYNNGGAVGALPTHRQLAKLGEKFFYALASVQLSLIFLAAPAAAAGSICIDRARGTLLHMMVTDLSDAEIVLGKLGARLAPVFGLVACGVPVAAVAGLLGGIDFAALLGLLGVSLTLAVLGCSLAMLISVRASKTHEVLMAVYMAEVAWLLAVPIWWGLSAGSKFRPPPDWFQKLNPYQLAFAPYTQPGFVDALDFAIFIGAGLGLSAALLGLSIAGLRRSVIESSGRAERPDRRRTWIARIWPSLPGPTLDGNPVLWREWHRNRPSKLARRLWGGMMLVTWALAAWGTAGMIDEGVSVRGNGLQFGLMLQLLFGLLMVAATAPTALAEERTRGSLDVLLATPLSTSSIVLAKWWGAYRMVLVLAILPAFAAIFLASATLDVPDVGRFRFPTPPVPLTLGDRFAAATCVVADFLASGALIVSLGLALATWVKRLGRAVGASVILYFVLGIGWPIAVESLFTWYFFRPTAGSWTVRHQWIMQAVTALSPIFGPIASLSSLGGFSFEPRGWFWAGLGIAVLVKASAAAALLWLTYWTFDRCLGRVVELRAEGPPPAPLPMSSAVAPAAHRP